MQFQPKTDAQIAEEGMLPDGDYDFSIDKAEDKISKKGREAGLAEPDMIEIGITVFSNQGDRSMKDWITSKLAWKVKHFAYAIGLGAAYEAGGLEANLLVGRSGKVTIKKGKPNGDYPPRNEVKDYVVPVEGQDATAPESRPRPAAPTSTHDEPPF